MGKQKRKFTDAFKQQVVEEVLNQQSTPAQIARRYNLSPGQLSEWIDKYEQGNLGIVFNSIEDDPAYMRARIYELERMVGKLAIENDLLKKANRYVLERRRAKSSIVTSKNLDQYKKDVSL